MNAKLEINLEDVFYNVIEDCKNESEFNYYLIQATIQSLTDKVFNSTKLESSINNFLKENANTIIDKVVDKVSTEVLKRKQIIDEMPKRNEIVNIDSDWLNYFEGLIDRAIARKFRNVN